MAILNRGTIQEMISNKQTSLLNDFVDSVNHRLTTLFTAYLQDIPSFELKHAMEYTLLNGGKRLRPLLIYATGTIFAADWQDLDLPAASVELIHTYSLIHDDLPGMDNADLRRGHPTCHKVYGEGMAILAGDALHSLAMQIMANHPAQLSAEKRVRMMSVLSKACGPFGMAGGQALDLTVMLQKPLSVDLLEQVYQLKTGALFSACIELGSIAASDDVINHRTLTEFGKLIGLAFQIQDDILDIEVETSILGKPQGLDQKNMKNTYPALHSLAVAKEKVEALYQAALDILEPFGMQAALLRDLTSYMLQRGK